MKSILLVVIASLHISNSFAQDSLLTYSRIIKLDSLSKQEIFTKTLVWCSKSFTDSKTAIDVKEPETGIIAGKALLQSFYKVPTKKDSTYGMVFVDYGFDWLIEIKDNKLRFSVKNIVLHGSDREYKVETKAHAPFEIMFQSKSKTELEWRMSKEYFIHNLDFISSSLQQELQKPNAEW